MTAKCKCDSQRGTTRLSEAVPVTFAITGFKGSWWNTFGSSQYREGWDGVFGVAGGGDKYSVTHKVMTRSSLGGDLFSFFFPSPISNHQRQEETSRPWGLSWRAAFEVGRSPQTPESAVQHSPVSSGYWIWIQISKRQSMDVTVWLTHLISRSWSAPAPQGATGKC